MINILHASCTLASLIVCQLERGIVEQRDKDRQQPAECLHFVATSLIMEECKDVLVMSGLDNRDYRSFRAN